MVTWKFAPSPSDLNRTPDDSYLIREGVFRVQKVGNVAPDLAVGAAPERPVEKEHDTAS